MKRYDQRTPRQIAHQRYTHKLGLPDDDLCKTDQPQTSPLAGSSQGRCSWAEITDHGVQPCTAVGRWGIYIPGLGARRRCTTHAAMAIRARLWLQRRRLQLGKSAERGDL